MRREPFSYFVREKLGCPWFRDVWKWESAPLGKAWIATFVTMRGFREPGEEGCSRREDEVRSGAEPGGRRRDGMRKALLIFTVAGLVSAFAIPPAAQASITGATELTCKTTLAKWPTPLTLTGTCTSYPVGAFGAGAGVTTTNTPYAIVAANAPVLSSFSYSEPCPVPGAPITPLVGFANGSITASKLRAVVGRSVTTASSTELFSWTRVGLVAVVTTSAAAVTFANGATATGVAPGAAVGTFVPLSVKTLKANVCPTGGPLTAEVLSVGAGAA
jgi:hypothetical protein